MFINHHKPPIWEWFTIATYENDKDWPNVGVCGRRAHQSRALSLS